MNRYSTAVAFVVLALSTAYAQDNSEAGKIPWQHGPAQGALGAQAKVDVPKGFLFAGAEGTRQFLELTQNIPSGEELGMLAPEDLKWFVIYEFSETGYVRDDEKSSLDADAMLKSIKASTEKGNEERKQRGWSTLTVLDWVQAPHYDDATHNLEWSTRCKDDKGNLVANHNTRYLGRRGVMNVALVADTDQLLATLPRFREVMSGFAYTSDNNYRAFVKGDKVAEYGLTALVVGGAAAAAAKGGVFKYLWKLVVAAVIGLGGLLKKLFKKKTEPAGNEIQPQ